ncbi:hypothetical protein ACFE04_003835 [Oxalis oulophora]
MVKEGKVGPGSGGKGGMEGNSLALTSKPVKKRSNININSNKTMTFLVLLVLLCIIVLGVIVPVFAPLPPLTSSSSHFTRVLINKHNKHVHLHALTFTIDDDKFWKDGKPFQIIGGDLHYFRLPPQYWEDRLLRAKALGLNTIQTYVPWNLHEPNPGNLVFEGFADIVSFLKLCHKHGLLVLLRPGPYICGEWDLGGFPAWLLNIKPALKLRSSDPSYLKLVEKWWEILLPKVEPLLYHNGGPIVMVQIENEYGSYGNDKAYLHHLVKMARGHLGDKIILYTTDGGSRDTLTKGTIKGADVFSAVDFTTGDDPWPIFKLQKEFNSPGKSPPLSSEFYTGWLTHWGEKNAETDADFTAASLEKILSRNGSAMAHGGTNFGFYNGANTGGTESDYQPDLTSYDYDAPIKESGDVDNAKFKAIRSVIAQYSVGHLPPIPPVNGKAGYGPIRLKKTANLFDLLHMIDPSAIVESESPNSMESLGQMFGFVLYVSEYTAKVGGNILLIPKVHDRAQVFISCTTEDSGSGPTYVATVERTSNQAISLPNANCALKTRLFVLVENMGRVNYGQYLFDQKGILSPVYLDGKILYRWKMFSIPFHNLNEVPKNNRFFQAASGYVETSGREHIKYKFGKVSREPMLYAGKFTINNVNELKDTYLSFSRWGKGIAFVNEFNIGRYWPSRGPQCNLYVPAPILRLGENVVVIFELESSYDHELIIDSVDVPDFTCGSSKLIARQL